MIQVADFEAIFLRFQGPLTRFIARSVGNREQAFDIAQDVFEKVYKALLDGKVIPQRAITAWLYRIATNTIIDMLRRQHLIAALPLSLFNEESGVGTTGFSPSTGTGTVTFDGEGKRPGMTAAPIQQNRLNAGRFEERVADRQIIEQVFPLMPPKYGVCLWLHVHDGLSCPKIAETLHITVSATKMRLLRAREQFRTLYMNSLRYSALG
jgi:RNA polymerase sigma-70 factor (ECF subfamily)